MAGRKMLTGELTFLTAEYAKYAKEAEGFSREKAQKAARV
jgi:hypothetical protein